MTGRSAAKVVVPGLFKQRLRAYAQSLPVLPFVTFELSGVDLKNPSLPEKVEGFASGARVGETLSIGVGAYESAHIASSDMEGAFLLADRALYRAKDLGRNRTECLRPEPNDGHADPVSPCCVSAS